jgi:hypothetical protein
MHYVNILLFVAAMFVARLQEQAQMKLMELIQKLVEVKRQYQCDSEMATQYAASGDDDKASLKRAHVAVNVELILDVIGELERRYPMPAVEPGTERPGSMDRIEVLTGMVERLQKQVMSEADNAVREQAYDELGAAHYALMLERMRGGGL